MFTNAYHTSRVLLTSFFDSRGRLEDERGVEGSALDAYGSLSIWLLVVKRCLQAWPLGISTAGGSSQGELVCWDLKICVCKYNCIYLLSQRAMK